MEEQKRSDIIAINGSILHDKRLTPTQKLVYARIAFFEEYFEGAEAAADFLGLTVRAVREAKRVLEQLGYIRCVRNTGRGKSYVTDLQSGLWKTQEDVQESDGRCTENGNQMSKKAESDIQKLDIRCPKIGYIDKELDKIEKRTIINKEKKYKKEKVTKFKKPTLEEVEFFILQRNLNVDPEYFIDYYEANGWKVGKVPMKDWKAVVRNWHRRTISAPASYKQNQNKAVAQMDLDKTPYEPDPREDTSDWDGFFDKWQNAIGMRPAQTVGNVRAARQLVKENDPETLHALLVALALRRKVRYLIKEIKNITTPLDLLVNRELVWNFYQENRENWQRQYEWSQQLGTNF